MTNGENMTDGENKKGGGSGKKWIIAVLCLLAVGLSTWSIAKRVQLQRDAAISMERSQEGMQGGAQGRQPPGAGGRITAVSRSSITIQGRDGTPKTFTLTAATRITVDQKPATAAGLALGQRARLISSDGKTAAEVRVRTRPFGRPGGRNGGPANRHPAPAASSAGPQRPRHAGGPPAGRSPASPSGLPSSP